MAGTIFVLILLPVWAFGSGTLLDRTTTGKNPKTPSDQFADSAVGCLATLLWFVQIALMGLSTRLSLLTPLIAVPASAFFYIFGSRMSEERHRQFDLVPFFDTFTVLPITPEERKSRVRKLGRTVLLGVASYISLLVVLALVHYNGWVP